MTLFHRLFRQDNWKTIPNAITALRFVLLPVFVVLIVQQHYWSSMVVIAVVFFTDFLDGYIARRTNTTSALGAWLDPVADRVTVIVVVVAFVLGHLVPWPVLVLLLVPDVVLSTIALIAFGGAPFHVTWVGKFRTAFIFIGLLLILVGAALVAQFSFDHNALGFGFGEGLENIGHVVLWVGLIGHYVAGAVYALALVRAWRAERAPLA
ncbi:CDP-alcohol phosphatidyltransferase family protein [Frigoribacterium sp. 2-23]|uniref:CDP-alcohol phosphatidyltransferase family protein n=1 Tax=Frigoribacterium sp. 2-23 TaxID=3415006 RepID=UPI003C6F506D